MIIVLSYTYKMERVYYYIQYEASLNMYLYPSGIHANNPLCFQKIPEYFELHENHILFKISLLILYYMWWNTYTFLAIITIVLISYAENVTSMYFGGKNMFTTNNTKMR